MVFPNISFFHMIVTYWTGPLKKHFFIYNFNLTDMFYINKSLLKFLKNSKFTNIYQKYITYILILAILSNPYNKLVEQVFSNAFLLCLLTLFMFPCSKCTYTASIGNWDK
jgi:hypothetical protein